jgi:MFS family permease
LKLAGTAALARFYSDPAQRNVLVLASCQALGTTANSIMVAVATLVGYSLVDDKSLATLPIAMQWGATMCTTIPASQLMRRVGRRVGFSLGASAHITGGLLGVNAIVVGSFSLFLLASFFVGVGVSFMQYYRFAAVDTAPEHFRSKAISLVLAGGVVAAILSGEVAKASYDWFSPHVFAGCYVAHAILGLLALITLQGLRIPNLNAQQQRSSGRALKVIARQPAFIAAVLASSLSFAAMILVMTATPLAMISGGLGFSDAATVIQWHVLAMYLPGFFTGTLIARFGVLQIMLVGTALMFLALCIATAGIDFINFWAGLLLIGVGWNFMFVGGSTLLTSAYTAEERAKVQAANDFIVFSLTALAAFSSGVLLTNVGWNGVNAGVAPAMAAALVAVIWMMLAQQRDTARP